MNSPDEGRGRTLRSRTIGAPSTSAAIADDLPPTVGVKRSRAPSARVVSLACKQAQAGDADDQPTPLESEQTRRRIDRLVSACIPTGPTTDDAHQSPPPVRLGGQAESIGNEQWRQTATDLANSGIKAALRSTISSAFFAMLLPIEGRLEHAPTEDEAFDNLHQHGVDLFGRDWSTGLLSQNGDKEERLAVCPLCSQRKNTRKFARHLAQCAERARASGHLMPLRKRRKTHQHSASTSSLSSSPSPDIGQTDSDAGTTDGPTAVDSIAAPLHDESRRRVAPFLPLALPLTCEGDSDSGDHCRRRGSFSSAASNDDPGDESTARGRLELMRQKLLLLRDKVWNYQATDAFSAERRVAVPAHLRRSSEESSNLLARYSTQPFSAMGSSAARRTSRNTQAGTSSALRQLQQRYGTKKTSP